MAEKTLDYNKDSPSWLLPQQQATQRRGPNRDVGRLPDNNHDNAETLMIVWECLQQRLQFPSQNCWTPWGNGYHTDSSPLNLNVLFTLYRLRWYRRAFLY